MIFKPNCSQLIFAVVVFNACVFSANAVAQADESDIGFTDDNICKPGIIDIPSDLLGQPDGDQDELPTNIEADHMQSSGENKFQLDGNARVIQGNRGVFADHITYNKETYIAGADGNIRFYTANGDEFRAESLELEVDTFIGSAQNVNIKFADTGPFSPERKHDGIGEDHAIFAPFRNRAAAKPDKKPLAADETVYVRARGTAETVDFEGNDFEVLHNAALTTCEQGNDDVLLTAKQIELDHAAGTGTAKSMKIEFKNVPIFYFPTVSFPITGDRKTGFLFPGFGYEAESGTIIEAPYYINIAPQYDATITPRVLSKRGLQLYGEFRYLTEASKGGVRAEVLPSDDQFDDEDRHAFSFYHDHSFGLGWTAKADLQDVSDTRYLNDFSSDVDVANLAYIPQKADLGYSGDRLRFNAKTAIYQRVNDNVSISDQPYERLPEVQLDLRPIDLAAFEFGIDSKYTLYNHDDRTRVDGSRLRIKPYLSLPLEEIYGYLTPKFSVQTISYDLKNNPAADESPSVSVPIFSIDSGLLFERLTTGEKGIYLQTLEPRLFYLNIPDKIEQEAFPDFDTGEGSTSSFSHFFRENRFFGGDRVGDTHQISLGLTSRIIDDDSGEQRFKFSLGQVFFIDDREVGLTTDSAAETEDRSDFLAEFSASVNRSWSVRSFARWGETENELAFISFSADHYHSHRRNTSIGYSKTTEVKEQLNIDFELPLHDRWQLEAGADYSLEDSELRSSLAGISYDGCCWAAELGIRRYLGGSDEYKNRLVFTFELDDLGRVTSGLN